MYTTGGDVATIKVSFLGDVSLSLSLFSLPTPELVACLHFVWCHLLFLQRSRFYTWCTWQWDQSLDCLVKHKSQLRNGARNKLRESIFKSKILNFRFIPARFWLMWFTRASLHLLVVDCRLDTIVNFFWLLGALYCANTNYPCPSTENCKLYITWISVTLCHSFLLSSYHHHHLLTNSFALSVVLLVTRKILFWVKFGHLYQYFNSS